MVQPRAKFMEAFSGATASQAGEKGMVPAPSAGEQGYYLRGDGSWVDTTAEGQAGPWEDGRDGALSVSGSQVASNIFRYTDLTINSGTRSFSSYWTQVVIHCSGTLWIKSGARLQCRLGGSGGSGGLSGPGQNGSQPTAPSPNAHWITAGGGGGGGGGDGSLGYGGNGAAGRDRSWYLLDSSGGGSAGSGQTGNGSNGGDATAISTPYTAWRTDPYSARYMFGGWGCPGSGGGAGTGDFGGNGGVGGIGGGALFIYARKLILESGAYIDVAGVTGGGGGSARFNGGGGGGGGGGAGGCVFAFIGEFGSGMSISTRTASLITLTVSGGSAYLDARGGNGGSGGSGSGGSYGDGGDGGDGEDGVAHLLKYAA